jgi:hypothetical protein
MTMKIERELTKVHNDFSQTPNFVSIESLIPPYHETEEDGKVSYVKLASGIEAELPYVRVVVGRRKEERKENIYALQCSDTGVKSVRVTAPVTIEWKGMNHQAPRYYAIRPLSNQLISRDQVSIYSYSEGKLTDESLSQNFNNIDMDIWARWFLKDYETLLRSDYYTAIYQSNTSHETFDKIIQCKLSLAEAIATGVDLVFKNITTESEEPIIKAISKSEQLLRNNLLDGYAVDAIAQYDVNCETMWNEWAPRLEGIVKKDNTVNKDHTVNNEAKTVSFQGEPITLQNGLSYTHMVLKTNHPEFQKRIPLDQVQYLVQQLEWDRSLVSVEKILVEEKNSLYKNIMSELSSEELEDSLLYENSSWLKFVLPFRTDATITLGYETDIPAPVPLRWFPTVPEIRYHRTKKSNESPEHYENALQWDYLFSYRHEHFEQDSIHVMIEWNIDPKLMLAKSVDLFHALAQYTTIREDLLKDLEGFLSYSNNTVSNNALETFLTLAEDIKDNWMNHFSMSQIRSELIQNRIYEYVVQRITKTNPDDINQICLDKMYVTRDDNQSEWPELQIEVESSGEKITLRKVGEEGNDNGAFYFCDDIVEASDKITINLIYKELDIYTYQNAKGSVYVKRNDDIMKDYGIALNEAFIYETGKAETPSVVTPYLSYDKTYSVGKLFDRETYSYEDSQLPVVLSKLTGGSNDIGISMEIRYGLKIADVDQKPLYSYIPAYYMPSTFLDSIDTDSIINACINWWQNNNLMNKEGIWQYDVTIYSKFEDKLPLCSLLLEFTN